MMGTPQAPRLGPRPLPLHLAAAITSFASMFSSLVKNLQSMDTSLAYNVAHPSGS